MPKFRIGFHREVRRTDRYEVVIEADSVYAAREQAYGMADDFDDNCPDGVAIGDEEHCDSWQVADAEPEKDGGDDAAE